MKEKELFELMINIMENQKKLEKNSLEIERISDDLSVNFIDDYKCDCSKNNISFSIGRITGSDNYIFFDYSKDYKNYNTCDIDNAINILEKI